MAEAKFCPFLLTALMKGIPQVPVVDGDDRPLEQVCCRKDCQWFTGGKCAMQSIAERMEQVGQYLDTMQRDVDMA